MPCGLVRASPVTGHQPDLWLVCRYWNKALLHSLVKAKQQGGRVIYFMDDDLLDPGAWTGLPWRYRWKLYAWAYRYKKQIESFADEVWVSTEYLAQKYPHLKPKVLSPLPLVGTKSPEQSDAVHVSYHGSAAHGMDLDWLMPIMARVLQLDSQIHFELFGDKRVAQRFRDLPRTVVMHPLPWPQYQAYTHSRQADIGLAPLLPSPFNAARGPTKWFDYARMGAVGVYTDAPAYKDFVRHGVDGYLLANDPDLWVKTIVGLADDMKKRRQMMAAINERLKNLKDTDEFAGS